MNELHVDADLSAYLDGELAPAVRVSVDAHVGTCARCRSRLAELRAAAALVAALPAPRPARSLVPRVAERFNWLRPVRALSAVATGAFLFAFLVTAVARGGTGLGGGDASTAIFGGPSAATAALATPAPAAAGAAQSTATADKSATSAAPAPAPQVAAPVPQRVAPAASQAPQFSAPAAPTTDSGQATRSTFGRPTPGPLVDPLFWLGLAVVAAVAAIAAHLRLRKR